MMGKRRLARECALEFLYQIDTLSYNEDEENLDFDKELSNFFLSKENNTLDENTKEFMTFLATGVYENFENIDRIIAQYSDNWSISRMARIDRNVLRLAVYEMMSLVDIPHTVTINEAVDIAKQYGTNESGAFINGIIDRVRIAFERGECK